MALPEIWISRSMQIPIPILNYVKYSFAPQIPGVVAAWQVWRRSEGVHIIRRSKKFLSPPDRYETRNVIASNVT